MSEVRKMNEQQKIADKQNTKFRGIKAFIPTSALNAMRNVRANKSLKNASRLTFNSQNLLKLGDIQLDKWLNNSDCAQNWSEDQKKIAKILGHQDKYGGVNPGDRQAIYTLINALKPENILEIGTHIGASTLYFASVIKRNGVGKLTTVDILDVNAPDAPWKGLCLPASPKDNLKTIDCDENVEFIQSNSKDFLEQSKQKFDLIFLDGDHGAKTVYQEVSLALNLLKPNGILLLHDFYPDKKPLFPDGNIIPGPYLAIKRVCEENTDIKPYPLGELPWKTKQNVNTTSLAILTRINKDK